MLDEIEAILIQSDIGLDTAVEIIEELRAVRSEKVSDGKALCGCCKSSWPKP